MAIYPYAIWRPGPAFKCNGGQNLVQGAVCHSMVGSVANALAELDNPSRDASWQFSVAQDGTVYQHYDTAVQCWQAGSSYNNFTVGIEHEGGPLSNVSEPLTDAQRDASVDVVRWLASVHNFQLIRRNGIWEHNEVSDLGTQCPSGRIPWQYYTEDDEMWHRINGKANWWNGRALANGFSGTMRIDIDFPNVPANAQAVDLEVFLNLGSAGRVIFKDGNGSYAGQVSKVRPQTIIRVVPVNRSAQFSVEGGGVTVDLLGIVGYIG